MHAHDIVETVEFEYPVASRAIREAIIRLIDSGSEWLMWLKIVQERAPDNSFNVQLTITPHTIPDTSLERIIKQAHPMHVTKMLTGLMERFEEHEAPHEMRDLARCLKLQFDEWAEKAYAPGT